MSREPSDREEAILQAALTAFSRYGFTRTKMEDIATESGVARTALYKVYRNKEHVFRALAEQVHLQALREARRHLESDDDFQTRLRNALIARDAHLLQIGHSGPHAAEISELYLSLAGDLADRFNAELVRELAAATTAALEAGVFKLPPAYQSPEDFAFLLRLALEGVKKEVKDVDGYRRLARQLIAAML